jgi:hypothetical protein
MSNKPSVTPGKRVNWFDDKSQTPLIEQHARKLTTFLEAMSDGRIDDHEIKAQETRVLNLMKEIEPKLDDALHAKVTELLCEMTAHDLMQMLYRMQQARPKTVFRG